MTYPPVESRTEEERKALTPYRGFMMTLSALTQSTQGKTAFRILFAREPAKRAIVRVTLRCARALLFVGLVILLGMGCQEEEGATGPSRQGLYEIIALIEAIVRNSNATLEKLSDQKQKFASDGSVQGEQLMEMAATNVKVIKKTSLSVKRQIDPSGKTGALMSSALADSHVSPQKAQAEMKEKLKDIQGAMITLEENVDAAEKCCGLAPNFLDKNLQTFRADTSQLEVEVEQIMDHQYG
jgi:hypothetical protein